MASKNYIAAVDLGSSRIAGIVGTRSETGAFTVVACETEDSADCIRRGNIYNVENAAFRINSILKKLSNKIPGLSIAKVYVGAGGQSLRTIEHVIVKSLGVDGEVSKEVLKELYDECHKFKPEGLEVLSIVSPAFYLDGHYEANPVGAICSRIEARFKLIVCQLSLKRNIVRSFERAKLEIADLFVAPLALADMVLSEEDKALGCALIDFGAGVTSLTVFKKKRLVDLWVVPLGSQLITKDIMSLNIVETEAERLKKTFGDATPDSEDTSTIQVNMPTAMGPRSLQTAELNEVVNARMQEILENVYTRLKEAKLLGTLGAGLVITGGGALLKNIETAIYERFQMDVRHASIRKCFAEKTAGAVEPEFGVAVGLFMKGTINCAAERKAATPQTTAATAATTPPYSTMEAGVHVEGSAEATAPQPPQGQTIGTESTWVPPKRKKSNKKTTGDIIKKVGGFVNRLFDDEDTKPTIESQRDDKSETNDDKTKNTNDNK